MKQKKIVLFYIILALLIMYFSYESKNINIVDSKDFFTIYFDSFQKYLFIGTIISVPSLILTHINYFQPETRIRLKNKIFEYALGHYIIYCILLVFYIFLLFIITSYIQDYECIFSILNTKSFIRAFSFFISCFVIKEIIYNKTQKMYLGIASVVGLNFLLLIILMSVNYYIKINSLSEGQLMNVLSVYIFLINIFGILYLYFNQEKKELIK